MRQAEARPLLDRFWSWCDECRRESLPKSALGLAIQYALNLRPALERHIEDGALDIDNNACDRSLRGIAIGRRNWLFTGSEAGGTAAAAMFTLIGIANLNGVDPYAYLRDIFTRLPTTPLNQLDQFLPDRWAAQTT